MSLRRLDNCSNIRNWSLALGAASLMNGEPRASIVSLSFCVTSFHVDSYRMISISGFGQPHLKCMHNHKHKHEHLLQLSEKKTVDLNRKKIFDMQMKSFFDRLRRNYGERNSLLIIQLYVCCTLTVPGLKCEHNTLSDHSTDRVGRLWRISSRGAISIETRKWTKS